jgi:Outer membrane protein beta-barrel domain
MKVSSLSTLVLGITAALALRAEPPRYGVQGLVNVPLGDLNTYLDHNLGIGVGLQGTFDLGGGHMLRPRLDYSLYQQASVSNVTPSASYLSLGGDYLYFIAGQPEGYYLTAGLAAMRWSFQHQNPATDLPDGTTKWGVAAGIGYQWDYNIGTELRWLHSSVSGDFNADSLQGSVTFRF